MYYVQCTHLHCTVMYVAHLIKTAVFTSCRWETIVPLKDRFMYRYTIYKWIPPPPSPQETGKTGKNLNVKLELLFALWCSDAFPASELTSSKDTVMTRERCIFKAKSCRNFVDVTLNPQVGHSICLQKNRLFDYSDFTETALKHLQGYV